MLLSVKLKPTPFGFGLNLDFLTASRIFAVKYVHPFATVSSGQLPWKGDTITAIGKHSLRARSSSHDHAESMVGFMIHTCAEAMKHGQEKVFDFTHVLTHRDAAALLSVRHSLIVFLLIEQFVKRKKSDLGCAFFMQRCQVLNRLCEAAFQELERLSNARWAGERLVPAISPFEQLSLLFQREVKFIEAGVFRHIEGTATHNIPISLLRLISGLSLETFIEKSLQLSASGGDPSVLADVGGFNKTAG